MNIIQNFIIRVSKNKPLIGPLENKLEHVLIIAGRRFELAMAVLVSLVSVNAKLSSDSEALALTGTKEARTAIADEDRAVLLILCTKVILQMPTQATC